MATPDTSPKKAQPEAAPEDAAAALARPFIDAHNTYLQQLAESWQTAQRAYADAQSAHTKACDSLARDLGREMAERTRRYDEEQWSAAQAATCDERRRAAMAAYGRGYSELWQGWLAAAQKHAALVQDWESTTAKLQKAYSDQCGAAYRTYLGALQKAWQGANLDQLPAALLGYVAWSGNDVARWAGGSGGGAPRA